ncbi:phytoene synthase [Arthroderma uncinatum]|uniref:phytoene synthase n=1 Tax=Arthroderma uncinatum TaxID=74035 RepID=UPI00144ACC6C|nr:phytoene synthase [Arthroderma uncinatum]KAF3481707.1 phytoene synthase [Arthroderma uncinatum]
MQWLLIYRFLIALPLASTLVPIALPTAYLWLVDTIALRRGTWVIENGTKMNLQLWAGFEVEEALFFLVTNLMVVLGLSAIDNAVALFEYNAFISTDAVGQMPSILQLIAPFLKSSHQYDTTVLREISQAVSLLQKKSQSMYLGSAVFEGQLRLDLIALYAFCRKADDLIDDAPDRKTAQYWIEQCEKALDLRFKLKESTLDDAGAYEILTKSIPQPLHTAIHLLPASRLPKEPLYSLLKGFEIDLKFDAESNCFPITTEDDLDVYAYHVASTVAILLLELVFCHYPMPVSETERLQVISAGECMGKALQYTNIARDIVRDAAIGRVYIPTSWLAKENLTPSMVIDQPRNPQLATLRRRILDKADMCYQATQKAIDRLPSNVRGPVRATVMSYMEIGQMLRENEGRILDEKLKVPTWRRLKVAWIAMSM